MRKSGKQELKENCKEAWEMLRFTTSYYGADSAETCTCRARWAAYAEAYFIVYGEVLDYEGK